MTKPMLLALAIVEPGVEECPAALVASGYQAEAASHTRAYTECMTYPYLPAEEKLAARLQNCAPVRARGLARAQAALRAGPDYRLRALDAARDAEQPFAWVDHIATNFPGCETDIYIEGDGSELPYAEN
jgi:hypothetical protein